MMGFWGKRKKFPEKDLALSLAKSKSKWFLFFSFFFRFYKACCYAWEAWHAAVHGVNNPFMMQMFVEGLECARLCSDIGDKMAAKRE